MLCQHVPAGFRYRVRGEYPLEINPPGENPPNCNPPGDELPPVDVHTPEITPPWVDNREPPEMNPQLMCIPRRKPPSVLAK